MSETFVKLATLGELEPGTMKCTKIGSRCILLANVDGSYYAVDDTCTHEDVPCPTVFLKGLSLHGSRMEAILDATQAVLARLQHAA